MHISTNNYAETTYIKNNKCILSEALNPMRVSGSLLISEAYVPPWGVEVPDADKLAAMLKVGADVRVVAFHYVKRGFMEVTPQAGHSILVEASEMAIVFGGLAHTISQLEFKKSVPVESILVDGQNPFKPNGVNKARSTSVVCGVFMMRNVEMNPLFSSLPEVLHVSGQQGGTLHNLPAVLNCLNREIEQTIQCTFMIERLLELLCAEVMRAHLENAPRNAGWFLSVRDPVVGRAMSMIHTKPNECWSVNRLAQGVAMSPSRFSARFSKALGDSPMAYVTKWRMNVAGRLLDESVQSVGKVAAAVGYENVAAFSRTFKRHLGISPAKWRLR